MPAISCSAPGKVILCGEHAVVYGKPAIALPVLNVATKCTILARPSACSDETLVIAPNIGLKCQLKCLLETNPIRVAVKLVLEQFNLDHLPVCEIQIHSSLPTAAGLGSSASTSVALIRALSTFLGHPFNNEKVNQLAFEMEKIHHGTPSGIDNTVITYAKAIYFVKEQPIQWIFPAKPLTLVIADTGLKGSTAKAVADVKKNFLENEPKYQVIFNQIAAITEKAKVFIQSGQLDQLGKQLTENHDLLQQMGVSCKKLDDLVKCALNEGALGAKLSGGGQGGNMIALVEPHEAERIAECLKSAGATHTIRTDLPVEG